MTDRGDETVGARTEQIGALLGTAPIEGVAVVAVVAAVEVTGEVAGGDIGCLFLPGTAIDENRRGGGR